MAHSKTPSCDPSATLAMRPLLTAYSVMQHVAESRRRADIFQRAARTAGNAFVVGVN